MDSFPIGFHSCVIGVPVNLGSNVVVELPPAIPLFCRARVAEEYPEATAHLTEGLTEEAGMSEGSEVKRLILFVNTG